MSKKEKNQKTAAGEILPDNCERRVISGDDMELRVDDGDSPRMSGYAAKFGKWSVDLGGFTEKIRAGAFDEALIDCDVRALKNHDPNLILGRTTSKTLRLDTNSVGLRFEVDVPDTTTGRDTVQEIRRKDITGCSFSFTTAEDDWKYLEDGTVQRTIIKVGALYDVGPVTYPAYPDTTVAARSLEAQRQSMEKEQGESQPEVVDPERQRQIERGYRKAGRIINRNRPAESEPVGPGPTSRQ